MTTILNKLYEILEDLPQEANNIIVKKFYEFCEERLTPEEINRIIDAMGDIYIDKVEKEEQDIESGIDQQIKMEKEDFLNEKEKGIHSNWL